MDLISLEIHLHLEIKGEHTRSKTYVWSGGSRSTRREPSPGQQARCSHTAWLSAPLAGASDMGVRPPAAGGQGFAIPRPCC